MLRYAHQVSPDSAVILITAVDDYEAAVQAVKAGGATDYIRKSPGLVDEIKLAINRALEKMALSRQNFAFKRDAATRNSLENIVGVSRGDGKTEADDSHGGLHPEHDPDLRRKRNRQRVGGACSPRLFASCQRALRLHQLRRVSRKLCSKANYSVT